MIDRTKPMRPVLLLALGALLGGCAAAPNPGHRSPKSTAVNTDPDVLVDPVPTNPEAEERVAEPAPKPEPARNPKATVPMPFERTSYGSLASGVPIAYVAGEPIDVTELIAHWMHHKSHEVEDVLDQLALSRLVLAEGQRLGVRVDPVDVAAAVDEGLAELSAEVERQEPGMTIDEFVRTRMGLNPDVYRKRLRYFAILRELTPLVIRTWLLDSEHASARMIALEDRSKVEEVRRVLDEGLSFEEAAQRYSAEPVEEERGRLMTVANDGSPMARMVFATVPGSLGGPFEQPGASVLVWVEERMEPIQGPWSEVADRVRASLVEDPFDRLEYLQWTEAMRLQYPVDYKPFLELMGEIERQPEED